MQRYDGVRTPKAQRNELPFLLSLSVIQEIIQERKSGKTCRYMVRARPYQTIGWEYDILKWGKKVKQAFAIVFRVWT